MRVDACKVGPVACQLDATLRQGDAYFKQGNAPCRVPSGLVIMSPDII